jgi:hypothetical protein
VVILIKLILRISHGRILIGERVFKLSIRGHQLHLTRLDLVSGYGYDLDSRTACRLLSYTIGVLAKPIVRPRRR